MNAANPFAAIENKLKSRLGNNKVGILAIAGDTDGDSLDTIVQDWNGRECQRLYSPETYYPSTYFIIEFYNKSMCVSNVCGSRAGNSISADSIRSGFKNLFSGLYRASKVSGASKDPYTIPNSDTIKYDNTYDTILEGNIKLTGTFSSIDININSTESLNSKVTEIINTYIDSLKDKQYYIGYGKTDNDPDKEKLKNYVPIETTQAPFSAIIPYKYTFSSSLSSSSLNKVKNIYLEASSYSTYISKDLDNMYDTNNEKLYFKKYDGTFSVHPLFSILDKNIHLIGQSFGNGENRQFDWYAFRNISGNCCTGDYKKPDYLVFNKKLVVKGNTVDTGFTIPTNLQLLVTN